jgi:hypothetical protein
VKVYTNETVHTGVIVYTIEIVHTGVIVYTIETVHSVVNNIQDGYIYIYILFLALFFIILTPQYTEYDDIIVNKSDRYYGEM